MLNGAVAPITHYAYVYFTLPPVLQRRDLHYVLFAAIFLATVSAICS